MLCPTYFPDAGSLVTTETDYAAGICRVALERKRWKAPYAEEARALQAAAAALPTVRHLLAEPSLQKALLTAAGVSDKANKHFNDADRELAIREFVELYLAPAAEYPEELAFRFLLTRGDTLGGKLRNLVGKLGEQQLVRALLAALQLRQVPVYCLKTKMQRWELLTLTTPEPERDTTALAWTMAGQSRVLLLNKKVPVVEKNVDLVLLSTDADSVLVPADCRVVLADPTRYLAFGELKGGVDPAGADEHWKTAREAFRQIRDVFAVAPAFFVGGAIVAGMAQQIWTDLQVDKLRYAANLTHDGQVAALANWLVGL